jgi:hypothetical protein
MTVAIAVVVLMAAVLIIDRIALWAESRGWIYWRRHPGGKAGGAAGLLNDAQMLIAPAHRHAVEEIESKKVTRSEEASGDNNFSLDTESGVVRFRAPEKKSDND